MLIILYFQTLLPIRRFGIHAPNTVTSKKIVTILLALFPKISSAKAAYGYLRVNIKLYNLVTAIYKPVYKYFISFLFNIYITITYRFFFTIFGSISSAIIQHFPNKIAVYTWTINTPIANGIPNHPETILTIITSCQIMDNII